MHLRGVVEDARLLVADEGVLVPAVPQAEHDFGELDRPLVAIGVRHVLVAAVVQRVLLVVRGHEVPGRAAAADLVERGELAGERIGLVVGRGRCRDEAEMPGYGGQRRQDRHRFELHDLAHATARVGIALQIDRGGIGEEQEVELAALGELGDLDHVGQAGPGMVMGVGVSPCGDMLSGLVHESAEMHHAFGLRHASLPTAVCEQRGLSRKFHAAGSESARNPPLGGGDRIEAIRRRPPTGSPAPRRFAPRSRPRPSTAGLRPRTAPTHWGC